MRFSHVLSIPPDGDDYMSLPGTITIAAGSTSQQLGLMALTDTIVESVEMFSFTVDGTATATVSIMDSTSTFIQTPSWNKFLPRWVG